MDPIYPRFALADPTFYDEPRRRARAEAGRFTVAHDRDWSAWANADDGHWSHWAPRGTRLPERGWKIHVATTPGTAEDTLALVSRHCYARGTSFKHLSHRDVLFASDSKEADRTASGKFLTLYPSDEIALRSLLLDLDAELGGRPGPYVLSDLRWNEGPLSVRYGAFTREYVDVDGVPVPAVRRESDGELEADVRSTQFVVPPWVTVPAFLEPALHALSDQAPPEGFPLVERALHHSNAGGVYSATDHDGAPIVLKEARPFAGLTPDGRDAATRLDDEARALTALRSEHVVPLRRVFDAHGHRFLVLERVDGISLGTSVVTRHPLIRAHASSDERAEYRDWALRVTEQLAAALDAVHAAGYSHGDLHPGNVLVTEEGRVVLLDFEMARPLDQDAQAIIGAPGFVPRDLRGGARLDRYALACIRLFLFAPLTALFGLDHHKADDLIDWIQNRFGTDAAWADEVRRDLDLPVADAAPAGDRTLRAWRRNRTLSLDDTIADIATELAADADFSRTDRAWPGDPSQFAQSSLSLAHGALGPLVALHAARAPLPDEAWAWYEGALEREGSAPGRLGLYDGWAGALWAQRFLGRHDEADRSLAILRDAPLDGVGIDLYGGLAGIGLTLLTESEADFTLSARVGEIAERVRAGFAARPRRAVAHAATGRAGLLRGSSGVALFALRYFTVTGDESFLHLALEAVEDDLGVCIAAPDGSLQVDEGWRTMPYWGTGSAGIAVVLAELVNHLDDPSHVLLALDGLRRSACAELVMEPGLFQGRAGLIHALMALARLGRGTAETDVALSRHLDTLRLHAIRRPHGLGFPGQGLLRLSCDFATGSAGVLTALTTYRALISGTRAPAIPVPFLNSPTDAPSAAVAFDLARIR